MLLVEALGEAKDERCPLIGWESESIDCDGFGGAHIRSLAYSSALVRVGPGSGYGGFDSLGKPRTTQGPP